MIFKYHTMHQYNCDLQNKNSHFGVIQRVKVRNYVELGRRPDYDDLYYPVGASRTLIVPEITSTRILFLMSSAESKLRPSYTMYFRIGKFIGANAPLLSPGPYTKHPGRPARRFLRRQYLINRAGRGASLDRKTSQWL